MKKHSLFEHDFWDGKAYMELTYVDGKKAKLPFENNNEMLNFFNEYYDSEKAKGMKAGDVLSKVEFVSYGTKLDKVIGKQSVTLKYTDGLTHTYVFNDIDLYKRFLGSSFLEYMDDELAEIERDDYETKGYEIDVEYNTVYIKKDDEVVKVVR